MKNKKPQKTTLNKADVNGIYLQVLKLVKSGITIQNACVVVGVYRAHFYNSITQEQKKELRFYKSTTLIHGTSGHFGTRKFMTLETSDDDDELSINVAHLCLQKVENK